VLQELEIFNPQLDIHNLPPVHHYWANRHLRPGLEACGFSTPGDFFLKRLQLQASRRAGPCRFLSLGTGNCDLEISLAVNLLRGGDGNSCCTEFTLECIDLNRAMLDRAKSAAELAGVAPHLEFTAADLNEWKPVRAYDAVIANQSLHHVVNLEHLFEEIRCSLAPGAPFLISDMIGRNGHQRWPEARAIVDEFWRKLPPSCRYNRAHNRFEACFQDHDCSTEGFEGIRSQDILPLLVGKFHFAFFFGFGNVIDPFIDRQFGPNLDPCLIWVRRFIDEVHRRDEAEQLAGAITPTHMLAVLTASAPVDVPFFFPRAPHASIRDPLATVAAPVAESEPVYDPAGWADTISDELAFLSRELTLAQKKAEELSLWGASLDRDVAERTEWAFALDRQVRHLEAELAAECQRMREAEKEWTAWASKRVIRQIGLRFPTLRRVYKKVRAIRGRLRDQ
jgi:SAM-dependent methyltransferase